MISPHASALIAESAMRAPKEGANVGPWTGLTIYRFTRPTRPRWDEVESLTVGIIAQLGNAFVAIGEQYLQDDFHYVVAGGRRDFNCQVVQASPENPVLCVLLQIDPLIVRAVSAGMHGLGKHLDQRHDASRVGMASPVDHELMGAAARFLRSLTAGSDRRVLAPLHLQELVYRLLQGEQRGRFLRLAVAQAAENPIAAALDFVAAHLAEPITIETLASQANLSTSAFSRVFRDITGRSPYQYVKQARLNLARQMLDEGRLGVADVSRAVGYTSVSHFIKEFRSRFGMTPGNYVAAHTFRGNVRAIS